MSKQSLFKSKGVHNFMYIYIYIKNINFYQFNSFSIMYMFLSIKSKNIPDFNSGRNMKLLDIKEH